MKNKGLGAALFVGVAALPSLGWASALNDAVPGELTGEVGVHWQREKPRSDEAGGFALGYGALNYESESLSGFNAALGVRGTLKLDERNDGDYRGAISDDLILPVALLRYTHDQLGSLTLGRQEVDFEWLNDFVEGATLQLTPMDDLEINLGWSRRQAVADPDEVVDFEKMNESKGLYLLDLKYSPLEWLELNPYYYHAPDLFQAPGIGITASYEINPELAASSTVKLALSSTDSDSGAQDGGVVWLEQMLGYRDLEVAAGFIKVDQDGNGLLESFGDQQPMEEGNRIFEPDARTIYLSLAHPLGPVSLGAGLAHTSYDNAGSDVDETEWNLVAGYEIMEALELELVYINVDNDDRDESYHTIKTGLTYRF